MKSEAGAGPVMSLVSKERSLNLVLKLQKNLVAARASAAILIPQKKISQISSLSV